MFQKVLLNLKAMTNIRPKLWKSKKRDLALLAKYLLKINQEIKTSKSPLSKLYPLRT